MPVSQHNEQQKNALFFKNHGLGEILNQNTLTSQTFLSTIHAMIKKKDTYYDKNPEELTVHKNAVQKIIEVLQYVEKNSTQKEN